MGNLQASSKVSLFCMDYMNKARLKIQGEATLQKASEVAPEVLELLSGDGPEVERVLTVDVVAIDWNCPSYIPDLFPAEVVRQVGAGEMHALRQENAALRAALEGKAD